MNHVLFIYTANATVALSLTVVILEIQYQHVLYNVGGNQHRFTVIHNTKSDIANGFVTPLNFRSEVEITPSRGKSMNPRSGDWLNLVLPHELVHALQMSVNPGGVTCWPACFHPICAAPSIPPLRWVSSRELLSTMRAMVRG